ncbi:hypothetical protein J2X12_004147 [Pseudarthrobacter oxydans]|uniref:ERF superfamily protein n=1 Tax=Pseudarthrobacter oxydans TaxID=1671 RepID=A0AAW8NET3_PSEOX|nr:ERF family protein [Pseudarthrobacter oxydans]MDR6794705.1 hypothetical protein [Pseudarthrobacter oxydans]MDR7166093.1 hypothetical protein [Pseudarthrobacter oxydans]
MSEPIDKPEQATVNDLFTDIPAPIAKALIQLQNEVRALEKTAKNDHFKNTYAPLDEVMDNALPLLAKNQLGLMQWPVTKGDKHYLHTILVHESGVNLQGDIELLLVKRDPQGLGSALTYTRRQTVMAILGLSAKDEDDDGNKASNNMQPANPEQIEYITQMCKDLKYPEDAVQKRLRTVKTEEQAVLAIHILQQAVSQRAKAIAKDAKKVEVAVDDEPIPVDRNSQDAVKQRLATFGFSSNKYISSFIMAHTKKPLLGNCGPEELSTLNEVLDRVERGEEKLPAEWFTPADKEDTA